MTNGEKYKTAKERAEAFWKWYTGANLPYYAVDAFAHWLDLEAEEEKPLPCPFCGAKCRFTYDAGDMKDEAAVVCDNCGYVSAHGTYDETKPNETYKESAIAAHNRVARAAKEKEANDANA